MGSEWKIKRSASTGKYYIWHTLCPKKYKHKLWPCGLTSGTRCLDCGEVAPDHFKLQRELLNVE